jgi:hypothetical protein
MVWLIICIDRNGSSKINMIKKKSKIIEYHFRNLTNFVVLLLSKYEQNKRNWQNIFLLRDALI